MSAENPNPNIKPISAHIPEAGHEVVSIDVQAEDVATRIPVDRVAHPRHVEAVVHVPHWMLTSPEELNRKRQQSAQADADYRLRHK